MYTQEVKALIIMDRNNGMSQLKNYDIPLSSVQHIVLKHKSINKKRGRKKKLSKYDKRKIKSFIANRYEKMLNLFDRYCQRIKLKCVNFNGLQSPKMYEV